MHSVNITKKEKLSQKWNLFLSKTNSSFKTLSVSATLRDIHFFLNLMTLGDSDTQRSILHQDSFTIHKLKNGSPVIKSILIILLLIVSCREESIFRFTKGIEPVFYSVEEDSIRDKSTGEILQDSKSCKSCHKKVFENWYNSRHRVAFTNELYKESHE